MSLDMMEKTYIDLCRQILCYQKCALIRPTGFGKTHLIARICKDKKSLIVVPSISLISDIKRRYGESFMIVTYAKLLSMKKKKLNFYQSFGPLDYICLDEMHRAGAEKWYLAVESLLNEYPNVNLIGASATPVRCDGIDITKKIFNNHQVFPYTIIDAMQDDILPKPIYVRALYDFEDASKEYLSLLTSGCLKSKKEIKYLEKEIKKKRINLEYLLNIPNIIKSNIPTKTAEKNMKFVVFCSTVEDIQSALPLTEKWFLQAFPKKTVNLYSLHSKKTKLQNAANMTSFIEGKGDSHIDLLFAVNMLNEGIHIDSVSGLLFFRKTKSHIIYTQQLGRCMEQRIKSPIVFDFVGNIEHISTVKESFGSAMGVKTNLSSIEYFDQYVCLKDYVIDIEKELKLLVDELSLQSKTLTEEEKQQILEMFHKQMSCKEIAIKLNRHPSCIRRFLGSNNLFYKRIEIEENKILSYYQHGMTIEEIANKFNCSKKRISSVLNNNGIKTDKTITKEEEDSIHQLFKEGKSGAEIAILIKRSKTSVNEIIKRYELRKEKIFDQEKIKQMYEAGVPIYQICKELKVRQENVTKFLEEIGMRKGHKIYKITEERTTEILNSYKEGKSISKISKETNIGSPRIKRILLENHIYQEPKKKMENENPSVLKKMIEEYRNGSSYYALSKKYPYSRPTIVNYFKENNIQKQA